MKKRTLTAILTGGTCATAMAVSPGLRDLEADRPDATESPVTVDAGHFQLETSFLAYGRDRSGGVESEWWSFAETNLKYGINDCMDLQLVLSPWVEEREKNGGVTEADGVGDIEVRLKWNLWGNDGGETALAVMPYVKAPVFSEVSNDHWEGGVIVPLAWRVADRWGVAVQAEGAAVYDEEEDDTDFEFSHTAVLGVDLTERVGCYLEYLGVAGDHPYEAYGSGGVTWALSDFRQLDLGAMVGLNEDAEDLAVFTGVTVKF
ncbi:MAG: transporter [Verrucomicrobia bacterium]|nr:transporter [Verrucomicrobiota bacterium]MDA1006121.1 transporter [Verrucomicrobiota bacterium]